MAVNNKSAFEPGSLDQRIVASQDSEELMEKIIRENQAYLQSRVSRFAPTSTAGDRDDIYSVALVAFYEAIKMYSPAKGHFYPFADMVIKRRIIDDIRKAAKAKNEIAILDDVSEDAEEAHPVYSASIENFTKESQQDDLRMEIEQFNADLKDMGMDMETLAKHSPKHQALKETYRDIIRQIRDDEEVKNSILVKRYYPVKKISQITKLSQKKVERSRIYVMAVILILSSDYPHLREYIPFAREI